MYRSPHPPLEIPARRSRSSCSRAPARGASARRSWRRHGPHDHVRGAARARRSRGGVAGAARHREGRRLRDLRAELARVPDRRAGDRAPRRRRHDGEPAVHERRPREAARRTPARECCSRRRRSRRRGRRARGHGRRARHHVRRAGRCAGARKVLPFSALVASARHAAARRDRSGRSRRAAVLERHDGPAERRDADAPQPRREHPADRRGRPLPATART